ncbi:YqaE/Pmp3 family membrane protein [Lacinutrix algicola]|uniref:YqaE/Pmp3 family membrane protein n=1 Tax=Lacinutrix algicola TaxID=342954 RepID=UPI0006E30D80|nr:YqaE/Pmp3 family membrane protein [Lacinutrix algicola]
MSLITIIINLLLPPLSVAMQHGIGGKFIVNLLLTLLGWFPGVIHAFYVSK